MGKGEGPKSSERGHISAFDNSNITRRQTFGTVLKTRLRMPAFHSRVPGLEFPGSKPHSSFLLTCILGGVVMTQVAVFLPPTCETGSACLAAS